MRRFVPASLAVLAALALRPPAASAGTDARLFVLAKTWIVSFRDSTFNPGGLTVPALGWRRGPLSELDATAEFETDALSLHWRLDLQGSLGQRDDGSWRRELKAGQFYLQKDLSSSWLLAAGRSIQRWGTGYVFNPTDVAAPDRELGDPENDERRAVGLDLVKLEHYTAKSSLALCVLSRLDTRGAWRLESPRLALRYYINAWDSDLSFIALISRNETPVLGLNASRVFGERLEVHGEAAFQMNSYGLYHAAALAAPAAGPLLDDFKRDDGKLYLQGLLGFQYTFPGDVLWVAEFYHRGQGYSAAEWGRVVDYVRGSNGGGTGSEEATGAAGDALGRALSGLAVYSPKGALRDYLVNYLENLGAGAGAGTGAAGLAWRIGWLLNLADRSGVVFPELRLVLRSGFTFYLRSYIFLGGEASEFGAFPRSRTLEGGLRFRL